MSFDINFSIVILLNCIFTCMRHPYKPDKFCLLYFNCYIFYRTIQWNFTITTPIKNRHSGLFWKSLSYPLYSQEISAKPVTLPTLLLSLDQLVAGEDIFTVTLQYGFFFLKWDPCIIIYTFVFKAILQFWFYMSLLFLVIMHIKLWKCILPVVLCFIWM